MRTPYPNELMHYGILGMKWGIRRYQNPDGSWTEEGRRRYGADVGPARRNVESAKANYAAAKKKYNRETYYGLIAADEKAIKTRALAKREIEWAKQDLRTEKAKARLNEETKSKSKHRLKLEQQYRKNGMSPEEAEVAAYKRARTEKILAVTLGVTATAAASYIAYKNYDKFFDLNLKSGTVLQSVSKNSNRGVRDAFCATYEKADKDIYRGFFAKQHLIGRNGANAAYAYNTVLGGKIKVASERNSRKILSDLVKSDPRFADKLANSLQGSSIMTLKSMKALRNEGKVDQKVWEAVNQNLVGRDPTSLEISKRFYARLRAAGYDAILDVNDRKYSGYGAKRPLIVFNAASKTAKTYVEQLKGAEIDAKYNRFVAKAGLKATVDGLLEGVGKNVLIYGGIAGAGVGVSKMFQQRNEKEAISNYRKEHPNSNLSDRDIVRMLYQE